jgi:hypothetical protein
MMYFKPMNLAGLRIISRTLSISMVDLVDASLDAYIFIQEKEQIIPPRTKKRFSGPRSDTNKNDKRIRYVMVLRKSLMDRIRDIACLYNKRVTHVCDEALSNFITFTKQSDDFKNTPGKMWKGEPTIKAVKGKKTSLSKEKIKSLLSAYKALRLYSTHIKVNVTTLW